MQHEKFLSLALTFFICFTTVKNNSNNLKTSSWTAGKKARHKSSGSESPYKKMYREQGMVPESGPDGIPKTEGLHEQDVIKKVLDGYNWRVRPPGTNMSVNKETGGPVIVKVNLYLRSISKIDDVNMEYSAQFTFRESWVDGRLAFRRYLDFPPETAQDDLKPKFVILTSTDEKQKIWMPDTFFQNEKKAQKHNIDKPNVMIRIYPDGRILYSVRLSLTLSCPMFLHYYPLDSQMCLIDAASYAYTADDIEYQWKETNPVQLKKGLNQSLPSFEIQDVRTTICTSKTNTGTYSCLRTELILRREFSYYLLQLYIPSFMLVIVSWVSFWLDKDSVPARVTLGVTTLLTMTTQSSGINAKLPPVSYTKAIDVWIGVCLAFIFGALLEFALVNYAARREITVDGPGGHHHSGGGTGGTVGPAGSGRPSRTMVHGQNHSQQGRSYQNSGMIHGGAMVAPQQPPPGSGLPPSHCSLLRRDSNDGYNANCMPPPTGPTNFGDTMIPNYNFYPGSPVGTGQRMDGGTKTTNATPNPYMNAQSQYYQNVSQYQSPLLGPPTTNNNMSTFPNTTNSHGYFNNTSQQQHQQQQQPQHMTSLQNQGRPQPPMFGNKYQHRGHRRYRKNCVTSWLAKYHERSKRIDVISRFMFPVGFFFFNCVYWTVYMTPT